MTPQQYLVSQLTPVLTANNPGASAAGVQTLATELAGFYLTMILPNLSVNLTTGAVSFVVPVGG